MHPIFVRCGVFYLFWDKKVRMHPNFVILGAFKKILNKQKNKKKSDQPTQEIELEGNTTA